MPNLFEQAFDAYRTGKLAEAEKLCLSILESNPGHTGAGYYLGMVYGQRNEIEKALHMFSMITETKPDFGEGWLMLSKCAQAIGRNELSLKASIHAVETMPSAAEAWLRHGYALNSMERGSEAIGAYRKALELDPKLVPAWINLVIGLKKEGQPYEAEQTIEKAIRITGMSFDISEDAEKIYGPLHWHLALLKLGLDHYREGFAYFRSRFKGGTSWKRFDTSKPLWRGENIEHKTLLITAEQGHGDMLMMARYLPLVKSRGSKIIFQTHTALKRYFTGWHGSDDVITTDDEIREPFDFHIPIFDLPYVFKTEFQSIPQQIPYLPIPEPDGKTHLPSGAKHKIGIVWAGQPHNARDKIRSVPLELLAPISNIQNNAFYSLAHEIKAEETAILKQYNITDLSPLIHDFADVARFVAQLDLVITCDTAMAHLAGGMGKPVWILVAFNPDWRWGYERASSPWYPSARLFRQSRSRDWGEVIDRVGKAFREDYN